MRRKRAESPIPILDDARRSLVVLIGPGMPDVDRKPSAPRPHVLDPPHRHLGVEADLADDVGRELGFLEHRLDRRLVVDQGVALGVAGDADLGDLVPVLRHRAQERGRPFELPRRLRCIAGDDEDLADARLVEPREDPAQVALVQDEPGRRCGTTS